MTARVLAALIGPLLRLLTVLGAYIKGRSDARTGAAHKAAEAKTRAYEVRQDVENEIAKYSDLAALARESGLLRRGGK